MKFKSISSDLLVTIMTLVAAFAAVTAAMASQQPGPDFERYDQAYPEPYPYPLSYAYNTVRVSVASDGTQANKPSFRPSISADGRYVAFDSNASNLVADNMGKPYGIFIHDIHSRVTTRLPLAFDRTVLWPVLSSDARYVVFSVYPGATDQVSDIYVHDRNTGQTSLVSVAYDGTKAVGYSASYSISDDGRYVSFSSDADNLVMNDTNGNNDVFVRDLQNGEMARVSVGSDGTQANDDSYVSSISANGRYVAFFSNASNLVAGDTNGVGDFFVHDCQTGETSLVSVASDGTQANGASYYEVSISADGRYVAFESFASSLVTGDTNGMQDIFIHDRQSGQTSRISIASDGTQANGDSYNPSISDDGRFVAFESSASTLAAGIESTWSRNIFIHDRQTGQTTLIPAGPQGFYPNLGTHSPSISANGRAIVFDSYASNLVVDDTNGFQDIFVYENLGKLSPADGATTMPLLLSLSWQASASAASYEYCYSSVPGPCTKWNSVGTNTSVTLSGLAPGYTYYWQARAVNPGGVIEADAATWWSFTTTTAPPNSWPPYTPPGSATFGDTPATHWAWDWIERLYSAGITGGCGNGNYCPEEPVTRAQIAVFLLRGIHGSGYTPPTATGAIFADVPATHWAANWVEGLYGEGITGGCGAGSYCPEQSVTRAQMAVFLLKARYGSSYSPPALGSTTGFGDVAADYWAAAWIKQLAIEGITSGCGNGNYCPEEPVTRAQMAVFLVRAFGLP